jgi:putative peptidoglycan lipid II flippase
MLPQGIFSVALATVLFPALARLAARGDIAGLRATMANGVRQIALMLIPMATLTLVLAEPITRLVYQRGAFNAHSTDLVSTALFWFSFSLPFAGINLLLTRTFFSLQRPWTPTALAAANIVVNLVVSLALYAPLGVAGPVIGTATASAAMTAAQARWLRKDLHGSLQGRATLAAVARMLVAALALAAVAYGVWRGLDVALGTGLVAQIVAVGVAILTGLAVYAGVVLALRVHEAHQVRGFVTGVLQRFR